MSKFLFSTFLMIALTAFFSACNISDADSNDRERVFFDDGGGSNAREISIEDTAIKNAETQAAIAPVSRQQSDEKQTDGTKISTMYDGYGNKTERRFFNRHPFLQAMVLRTYSNGQKEILLFGHNGEVKPVPPEMSDKAMTATADELAKAAGIMQGRKTPSESFSFYGNSRIDNAAVPTAVPDYPVRPANEETKIAQTQTLEKKEIKNQPNIKTAETEYQSVINNLNLRSKKNQTAQNVEKIDRSGN